MIQIMTKLKVILPYLMCMTVLVAFGETTVGLRLKHQYLKPHKRSLTQR